MREWIGCLVAVCLVGCGEVNAKVDAGGGDSGGSDDGSMQTGDAGGDGGASACIASTCGSGYCDPATDMCLAETLAIFVDPAGTDGATCGTKAAPCQSISGTAGALAQLGPNRKTLILAAGTYTEALRLSLPMTIYGPAATIVAPTAGITINVDAGTVGDVRLEGVTIASSAAGTSSSYPVYCQGLSTIHLVDATISNAKGHGLFSQGCMLIEMVRGAIKNGAANASSGNGKMTFDGTLVTGNATGGLVSSGELVIKGATITNNAGVGVFASGVLTLERSVIKGNKFGADVFNAAFTIRNNMIIENGGATSAFGGIALESTADRTPEIFEFNTVVNNANNPTGTLGRNIYCKATANTPITVSSSIAFGGTGTASSYSTAGNCSVIYSNVEGGVTGTGNINTAPTYKAAGDYHLLSTSAGVSGANPGATLATDFDGEARPFGAGRDIGADEVH